MNWYLGRTSRRAFGWFWIIYAAPAAGALAARVLPAWGSLALLLIILGSTTAGILHAADAPEEPSVDG